MITLVCVSLFAGYLLVYAAIHNGGEFATSPWSAVL